MLATFIYKYCSVQIFTYFNADIKIKFLFTGMVPERPRKMAENGDETGEQNGGKVFPGWFPRNGHVPRTDRVYTVAAAAQSALQRDGRPAQSQLDGLSIAPVLRFMSAMQLNINIRSESIGALQKLCKNLVEHLIGDTGMLLCSVNKIL